MPGKIVDTDGKIRGENNQNAYYGTETLMEEGAYVKSEKNQVIVSSVTS